MSNTITSSSGAVYHLWQLPEESAKEPEESIRFEELENDLGDGYSSQVLYGANTGLRSWKLKLQSLYSVSIYPNTLTGIDGNVCTREQYVWDLFCSQKVTGIPFVYQSRRNGQYFFVRFADKELSYQKMLVKIYSSGVELKQVRIPGESVFTPADPIYAAGANVWGHWVADDAFASSLWTGRIGGTLTKSGDVLEVPNVVNGHAVKRFNSVTNTGFLYQTAGYSTQTNDVFMVMKVREATFSNTAYIFGDHLYINDPYVSGASGSGLFTNYSYGTAAYQYSKNGVDHAEADQQAPMNEFGIVHARFTSAFGFNEGIQFGRNASDAATAAKIDVAEIICFGADAGPGMAATGDQVREVIEYLTIKYGIV